MKNLLLILLCVPMIGLGQFISGDYENGKLDKENAYVKLKLFNLIEQLIIV